MILQKLSVVYADLDLIFVKRRYWIIAKPSCPIKTGCRNDFAFVFVVKWSRKYTGKIDSFTRVLPGIPKMRPHPIAFIIAFNMIRKIIFIILIKFVRKTVL